MSDLKIESLLREVSVIQKHYEEIARLTGENFNIFKILNLSTSEVRTHSAFLAELLNPNGSHNQGAIYLQLFIDKMNSCLPDNNKVNGFVCDKAEVFVEKRIGTINKNKTEGGNIDILIKGFNGYEIVIENKINAGDQENQLIRYSNYIKKKKGILLYLNLDGHEATKYSTKDEIVNISLVKDEDYFIISYMDFITEWLEECHKEASSYAIIRESIKQYINIIKHITGKSINKVMEEQLVKILGKDSESVKHAFNISASIGMLKEYLINEFKSQLTELGGHIGAKVEFEGGKFSNKGDESYCNFILPNNKYGDYIIALGFDEEGDFGIGVNIINNNDIARGDMERLKIYVSKKLSIDFNPDRLLPNWIYFYYFEKESGLVLDFNNVEFLASIPNRELITKFKKILIGIKSSLNALE